MKDWKLEKRILSSKGEETRNCKVTVRIGDTVQGLPKKEDGNYEHQAGAYGTMGAAAKILFSDFVYLLLDRITNVDNSFPKLYF